MPAGVVWCSTRYATRTPRLNAPKVRLCATPSSTASACPRFVCGLPVASGADLVVPVPPQNFHHVMVHDSKDALHLSDAERHHGVNIILADCL